MFTLLLALVLAPPSPTSIDAPRRAYAACLRDFESKSLQAKLDAAAYTSAVKTACTAEADALMKALVGFDVAMGTKRPAATANAARDLEDYHLTSEERYKERVSPQ